MTFTLDQAELIGASIESVCFGIYLVLFPATIYVLVTRAKTPSGKNLANRLLLFGALFLFCCVVAHWILDQDRMWAAFITNQNEPGGPLLLYGLLRDMRNVIRIVFFVLEIITIDSLLLYRLYIIWNRNWRVCVLPAMTLVGTVVTCTALCIGFANAPPYVDLWKLEIAKWIVAAFSLSIATNIMAVVLISGRIMARNRQFKATGSGNLNSIITITIESAGLYCAVNLVTMIALVARTPFHFTVLAVASPVTGISFSLITLRVGLGKSLERLTKGVINSSSSKGATNHGASIPLQHSQIPMTVRITREQDYSLAENGYDQKTAADMPSGAGAPWA